MLGKIRAVPRVGESEFTKCAEIAIQVSNIVPAFTRRQTDSQHLASVSYQRSDSIRELNLAALPRRCRRQEVEDPWTEHISGSDGQSARGFRNLRFLNYIFEFEHILIHRTWLCDAVRNDIRRGDFLEGYYGVHIAAAILVEHSC